MKSLTVLAAAALLCAQQKPALKKFEMPDSALYTIGSTLLIKDEGCAKDYTKALAMEGVQQRKALAELLLFHCAERLGSESYWTFRGLLTEARTFSIGDKRFVMAHVRMARFRLSDAGTNVGGSVMGRDAKDGWVLRSILLNRQQLEAGLAAQPAK